MKTSQCRSHHVLLYLGFTEPATLYFIRPVAAGPPYNNTKAVCGLRLELYLLILNITALVSFTQPMQNCIEITLKKSVFHSDLSCKCMLQYRFRNTTPQNRMSCTLLYTLILIHVLGSHDGLYCEFVPVRIIESLPGTKL